MKLYYAPGACSLSPHIVLLEGGFQFETDRVSGKDHKTQSGGDYYAVNPNGYVPALQLDNGQVLTEGAVIVQYLADQKPAAKLAPAVGTMERYRMMEWLNFIATELHKGFSPLFRAKTDEEKKPLLERLTTRFAHVRQQLAKTPYLMGEQFTVADAYLFVMLNWATKRELEFSRWPELAGFFQRMQSRPSVQAALKAES